MLPISAILACGSPSSSSAARSIRRWVSHAPMETVMGGYSRDFAGAVQATNEMSGAMTAETFITVIILSLGMSAPIVAAFNFVDTLAQVGTTVAQVDEILKAEEQTHSETPVTFDGHSIEFRDVSFGYHDDKEILHGVSLTIPQNGMTALVGPFGSGKPRWPSWQRASGM